jgi:ankyrin repeat protein
LVESGAAVNSTDISGDTPLLLVESGAAVNSTDVSGDTPLLLAVRGGKLEIVRYPTERGSDINICNVHGDTAFDCAFN